MSRDVLQEAGLRGEDVIEVIHDLGIAFLQPYRGPGGSPEDNIVHWSVFNLSAALCGFVRQKEDEYRAELIGHSEAFREEYPEHSGVLADQGDTDLDMFLSNPVMNATTLGEAGKQAILAAAVLGSSVFNYGSQNRKYIESKRS